MLTLIDTVFCLRRTPRVNPFDLAQDKLPSSAQNKCLKATLHYYSMSHTTFGGSIGDMGV